VGSRWPRPVPSARRLRPRHPGPVPGVPGRRRRAWIAGLLLAPGLLAACGNGTHGAAARAGVPPTSHPVVSTAGSGIVPARAPRWPGAAGIVTAGATTGWIVAPDPRSISTGAADANLRPLWILYRVSTSPAVDVTPGGITTRGGMVVSVPNPGTIWVGIGSYQEQLDGVIGVSTDGGSHWTMEVLPNLFDPTPDGLVAQSSVRAWALVGLGAHREVMETTNGGASWKPVASSGMLGTARNRCQLSGLGLTGSTLWVGTTCTTGAPALVEGTALGGHWSLVPIDPGVGTTGTSDAPIVTTPPGSSATGAVATVATVERGSAPLDVVTVTPTGTTQAFAGTRPLPVGTAQVAVGDGEDAVLLHAPSGDAAGAAPDQVETSEDGGSSWSSPVGTGLHGTADAIGVAQPGVLWLVGSTGGKPALWESATNGAVWDTVALPAPRTSASLPGAGS